VRRLALLLALGSLGTPAAHSGEAKASPAFRRVASTRHVDYYATKAQRVDVRHTEAFLRRLDLLFGRAPQGWRIRYYRHASIADVSDHVGYGVSGVTDLGTGRIDSARDFHPHELVHAVTGREGRPPVFFAEGIAVALTSRGRWAGQDIDEVARREMAVRPSMEPFLTAFGQQDPDIAYAVAGSFVAFLLDRHGIEPMVAFVRSCGLSAPTFEQAFLKAYGRSVASLTIEWMTWLRRSRGERARVWYDPERWPGALRRKATPTTPNAALQVASSSSVLTTAGSLLAAEPGPRLSTAPGRSPGSER
jgi:hypothetical protein